MGMISWELSVDIIFNGNIVDSYTWNSIIEEIKHEVQSALSDLDVDPINYNNARVCIEYDTDNGKSTFKVQKAKKESQ